MIPSINASQYDFPSTPAGNATFFSIIWHKLLLSSLHLLQLFGSILFPGEMASLTLKASACWYMCHTNLLWCPQNILPPACICWQCSMSETIELSWFFLKLFNLLFLFLNCPNILCINPDILQRWCNVPIYRHCWCWCWWRCRCCVGIILFFMSSHHCWWTMQSQCDMGVLIWKKMKSCVAYLWLTQSFQSNVQMACLNLKWNHVLFEQWLLKYWGIPYSYISGVLKQRNFFAFL